MTNADRFTRSGSSRQQGFTLLELLAVLLIMGIVSGMAMLSMFSVGPDRLMEEESRRLSQGLIHAAREAVLNHRPTGLVLGQSGYRFVSFRNQGWHTGEDDDPYWNYHPFPLGMKVSMNEEPLDDGAINAFNKSLDSDSQGADEASGSRSDEKSDFSDKPNRAPHILFMPSGEHTPFVIRLKASPTLVYEIATHTLGTVAMRRVLNPDE